MAVSVCGCEPAFVEGFNAQLLSPKFSLTQKPIRGKLNLDGQEVIFTALFPFSLFQDTLMKLLTLNNVSLFKTPILKLPPKSKLQTSQSSQVNMRSIQRHKIRSPPADPQFLFLQRTVLQH